MHLGGLALLAFTLVVYTAWVPLVCLLLDTPFGRRSVGALSLLPLGICLAAPNTACQIYERIFVFFVFKLYMLASVRQPGLQSCNGCMVCWAEGNPGRNWRQKYGKTSFSPEKVFQFSRNPRKRFWGLVFWHLWIGRAKHPGPAPSSPCHFAVETFNVGAWFAHGDLALEARAEFLAVVEHRLISARVRSEWARLKSKGLCIYLGTCFSGFFPCW